MPVIRTENTISKADFEVLHLNTSLSPNITVTFFEI